MPLGQRVGDWCSVDRSSTPKLPAAKTAPNPRGKAGSQETSRVKGRRCPRFQMLAHKGRGGFELFLAVCRAARETENRQTRWRRPRKFMRRRAAIFSRTADVEGRRADGREGPGTDRAPGIELQISLQPGRNRAGATEWKVQRGTKVHLAGPHRTGSERELLRARFP